MEVIQLLISGISQGCVYGLIALGLWLWLAVLVALVVRALA